MSCTNCEHFNKSTMICSKYKEPIPVNIYLNPLKCETCRMKGSDKE